MDVNYFVSSNGRMQVYTSSGQALLDGSVHALAYEGAGKVTAGTVYSATPPSGFDDDSVDGKDITSHIKSGRIGALIDLRDDVLPAAQSELDELATELADALNAVHNQGTAIPPPASLTGSATVSAADALSATGTVRFAVTDLGTGSWCRTRTSTSRAMPPSATWWPRSVPSRGCPPRSMLRDT